MSSIQSSIKSGAMFSPDRMYRYVLTRIWDTQQPYAAFVGLNPSTADERVDDPTVRRCISFARGWNFGGIVMLNAFAYRATDPKDMKACAEPVGLMNDWHLSNWPHWVRLVIPCWGAHGAYLDRGEQVRRVLASNTRSKMRVFGLTKTGQPKHPLYLPSNQALRLWPT